MAVFEVEEAAFSTNLLWRPPVFESFLLHVFVLLFILVPFHDFYQVTKCVNLIRYLKNFGICNNNDNNESGT